MRWTRVRLATRPRLLDAAVPLVVFAMVLVAGLLANAFEYDADEGLNLMKATLVARGHALYRDVWSDQPPLHTRMLAGVFALTGPSTLVARALTAAFSALLVASLYGVVRRLRSARTGLIAAGLLLSSAWYPRLSFSVMIGLPALAVAMASLWLLVCAAEPDRRATSSWLLLVSSGVAMAVAAAIKLFAVLVLAPGIMLACVAFVRRGEPRDLIVPRVAVWLLVVLACATALALLMSLPPGDLLGTHLVAARQRPLGSTSNALSLLGRDWDLQVLALLALAMVFVGDRDERHAVLVPVLWLAGAAIAVQLHEPVWYHHGVLLTVPASWAGAVVIDAGLRLRARPEWARVLGVVLVAFAVWQGVKLATSVGRLFVPDAPNDRRVVEALRRRAPQTTWVIADRLMHPFAAGLVAPPELAVVSLKRREAGRLSDELILRVFERYRPEQVWWTRIDLGPAVREHLRTHYRSAQELDGGDPAKLWVRRDLPPSALPTITQRR